MKLGMVSLGLVLLVASIFGAKLVFNNSPSDAQKKASADASQLPKEILSWGYFDVRPEGGGKPGVAQLNPHQFGDVVFVVPENYHVKEVGETLLKVNDRLGILQIELAEADVKAAKQQLEDAKTLKDNYEDQKKAQGLVIKYVQAERKLLKLNQDKELSGMSEDSPKYKTVLEICKLELEKLDYKEKGEELKLKQLNLLNAQTKILQAEADLEAKEVRLKQAKETLKHFRIEAPSLGTVLRVNVRKGETIVPNPMGAGPAIEFLPKGEVIVKAEVLQEWGRFIEVGQTVDIEDDTYHGKTWTGTVDKISEWYAPTRTPVMEPFRYNDVRTLEIIIKVNDATGYRNGQRVRAKVKISR